jgi:hypothetical protein
MPHHSENTVRDRIWVRRPNARHSAHTREVVPEPLVNPERLRVNGIARPDAARTFQLVRVEDQMVIRRCLQCLNYCVRLRVTRRVRLNFLYPLDGIVVTVIQGIRAEAEGIA